MGVARQNEEARCKTKVRKSGPSALTKTLLLGKLGNVFTLSLYWDPTKRKYQLAMHLPKNWPIPKVGSMVRRTTGSTVYSVLR